MNISCNRCGKVHAVSEESLQRKKAYFYCSHCSQKVVVDLRTDTDRTVKVCYDLSYKDLFLKASSCTSIPTLLFSQLFAIVAALLVAVAIFATIRYNLRANMPRELFFAATLLFFSLLFFLRLLALYFISKISFYKMENGSLDSFRWNHLTFDFVDDGKVIFLYSIGIMSFLALTLVPLSLLQPFSFLYSALMFPISLLLVGAFFVAFIFKRYFVALLATGSYFAKDGAVALFRFIKSELITIPFYTVIILVISKFFLIICSALFSAVVLGAIAIPVYLSFPDVVQRIVELGELPTLSSHMAFASLLYGLITSIVALVFITLCDSFVQSLYVRALYIMKLNPERSIDGKSMLVIATGVLFLIALGLFFFLFILSLLNDIKIPNLF